MRSMRTLFIALVVVALSAGVAMAGPGAPSEPAPGLSVAAGASGATVSAANRAGHPADDEDSDEAEDADDADDAATQAAFETEDGGGNCVDPASPEAADTNHGKLVCWAAHQETPEAFANHGAYVSSIARGNHGHDTGATQGAAHKPSH